MAEGRSAEARVAGSQPGAPFSTLIPAWAPESWLLLEGGAQELAAPRRGAHGTSRPVPVACAWHRMHLTPALHSANLPASPQGSRALSRPPAAGLIGKSPLRLPPEAESRGEDVSPGGALGAHIFVYRAAPRGAEEKRLSRGLWFRGPSLPHQPAARRPRGVCSPARVPAKPSAHVKRLPTAALGCET